MIHETFGLSPALFALAVMVTFVAGLVKGVVGFAMPMIMISGLSTFLPAPTALATLILATVLTNLAQALRLGPDIAVQMVRKYWRFIGAMMVMIAVSAPLVPDLPYWLMYLIIGGGIVAFVLSQLTGRPLVRPSENRNRHEVIIGAVAGFFGGVSGVWGPPLVAYLLTYNTEKREMILVQGVVFLIGGMILAASHVGSGVLNAGTLPLAVVMIAPAFAGLWVGFRIQDRINLILFRKLTLIVLLIAGVNLLRKVIMG